jgi:putative toxin-antitoxin system antitoxin component (TIGR02293 family)
MIAAERIARILGGRPILRRDIHSLADLADVVGRGLPKKAFEHTIRAICADQAEIRAMIHHFIPRATYQRRTRLSIEESQLAERLARVFATAEYLLGSGEGARHFMLGPHPMLGDKSPYDVARTELGARRVEELLWQGALGHAI